MMQEGRRREVDVGRIRLEGDHSAYHAGSAAVWAYLCAAAGDRLAGPGEPYDTLIVNGEGSMHHGSRSFHAKMGLLRSALDAGKRGWLVNSVWQENPSDHDDVLARLDRIVLRETMSRDDLFARHGITGEVAPDLSFFEAKVVPDRPLLDAEGNVMVTDFYWPAFNGFARITEGRLAPCMFLDLSAGNWGWAIDSLRTARLLVTGRHHAVYAACRARMPFVALGGNSHKIEGLVRMAGSDIPVCVDPAALPGAMKWAAANRAAYDALFDWMERQPRWEIDGPY